MTKRNFWVLDFDPEGEIYESLSWDLPGFRAKEKQSGRRSKRTTTRAAASRK